MTLKRASADLARLDEPLAGQFWFDYMVSYTAGANTARTMAGDQLRAESSPPIDVEDNSSDALPQLQRLHWTEAADMVANGTAAMNLMGTFSPLPEQHRPGAGR